MTIKIKVCDTTPNSACSYYRGMGVLTKLRQIDPKIEVEFIREVTWIELIDTDLLYLVRPVENVYIDVITFAHDFGVKVWIDFDDLLHEIPYDNPSYLHFSNKDRQDNIIKALATADIVTVSTQAIKDYYGKINPNIIVIENAVNDYNFKFEKKNNNTKTISWRGSDTHREDLLSCKQQFANLSHNHTDWRWTFVGGDPWYLIREMKRGYVNYKSAMEIVAYNKFMNRLAPEIHVTPLVFSKFNEAKSNCVWLSATLFGAAVVAPAMKEFSLPGIQIYKDAEYFEYYVEKMMKSKVFRQQCYTESFEYIKENLLLSTINKKRVQIIREKIKK